jgi:hypothetical protein
MTLEEIAVLGAKWADVVLSHPDGTVDLLRGQPGWPSLPPWGHDRLEVVRELLTQLGPGYSIDTNSHDRLLVRRDS